MDYTEYTAQEKMCIAGIYKEYFDFYKKLMGNLIGNDPYVRAAIAEEMLELNLSLNQIPNAFVSPYVWHSMSKEKKNKFCSYVLSRFGDNFKGDERFTYSSLKMDWQIYLGGLYNQSKCYD